METISSMLSTEGGVLSVRSSHGVKFFVETKRGASLYKKALL